jgi:hypothetical protein
MMFIDDECVKLNGDRNEQAANLAIEEINAEAHCNEKGLIFLTRTICLMRRTTAK